MKFYRADGSEEPSRRADVLYKMTTIRGEAAYQELSFTEQARRNQEEADSAAWKAFEAIYPARAFTRAEFKAWRTEFRAGRTYVPPPPPPTLDEKIAAEVARQLAAASAAVTRIR